MLEMLDGLEEAEVEADASVMVLVTSPLSEGPATGAAVMDGDADVTKDAGVLVTLAATPPSEAPAPVPAPPEGAGPSVTDAVGAGAGAPV